MDTLGGRPPSLSPIGGAQLVKAMGRGGIPKESYPDSRPISSLQPKPIERLPNALAPEHDGLCSWAQNLTQSPMCSLTNDTDPSPFSVP